jgi:catalase
VPEIRQRMVDNLAHVDLKLATRVAAPLGIKPPDPKAAAGRLGFRDYRITSKVEEDPALRMVGRPGGSAKTRKVAILVADGVEAGALKRLQQDLRTPARSASWSRRTWARSAPHRAGSWRWTTPSPTRLR